MPTTPGSLEEALECLRADHEFLMKGDVFGRDLIEAWLDWKQTQEVDPIRMRPTAYEFTLYCDT